MKRGMDYGEIITKNVLSEASFNHKFIKSSPAMFCRSSMATSLRVTSSCFRKLKGNASSGQFPSHRITIPARLYE
jgi:hypothetical protein